MALAVLSWLVAIPLLGAMTGLRSLLPLAVLCWFAWLKLLPIDDAWAAWTAKLWVVIVITVLAAAECFADKLPRLPDRTNLGPLIWRLFLGGLIGALVAGSLDGPVIEGIILGVGGALAGTFAGFLIRRDIVNRLRNKDWMVGLLEDIIALGCAILAMGIVTG